MNVFQPSVLEKCDVVKSHKNTLLMVEFIYKKMFVQPEVFNCYWADCDFGSMQKSDLVEHLSELLVLTSADQAPGSARETSRNSFIMPV